MGLCCASWDNVRYMGYCKEEDGRREFLKAQKDVGCRMFAAVAIQQGD